MINNILQNTIEWNTYLNAKNILKVTPPIILSNI